MWWKSSLQIENEIEARSFAIRNRTKHNWEMMYVEEEQKKLTKFKGDVLQNVIEVWGYLLLFEIEQL